MKNLAPIDAHTHINLNINRSEINNLGAFVMVVTRTLDEADKATIRKDGMAVWGVGCHPGLSRAQREFNADRCRELLGSTPLAGELGLDGKSRVPMDRQVETLAKALDVLQSIPRLTSLHSYAATGQLIELLELGPPPGVILHWWLGDARQTKRAVELGCFFSVNASSVRRKDLLALIPSDRILTETDHPFGDRWSRVRRPGNVEDVERRIGIEYGMDQREVRALMWSNLRQLISVTGCSEMLPPAVRSTLGDTSR